MNKAVLERILSGIPALKISVLGDACLDVYWDADMTLSELSREVPQYPMPIVAERQSLGAGANAAANLAAIGVKNLRFIGAAGKDWRGETLRMLFRKHGISDESMVFSEDIATPAYCKPILHGISPVTYEAPRLDFVNRSPLPAAVHNAVLENLKASVRDSDVLVICDQFANGAVSEEAIRLISSGIADIPVIVDSRNRLNLYRRVTLKPNEVEAARALGLPSLEPSDPAAAAAAAEELSRRQDASVLLTLGAHGAILREKGKTVRGQAYPVTPPIDFVGAGDSFLAGYAAALALGENPEDRLAFAALVSAVTVKKIGTTGTASPDELRHAFEIYASL